MKHRRGLLTAYAFAFYGFIYVPIILLVVLSFNDSEIIGLPFRGATTKWYAYVLQSPDVMAALLNSFLVGLGSATIGTILSVLMAMGFRNDFPLKSVLSKLILLPILIPGIVGGGIYLSFFGYAGVPFGLSTTVLIVHVTWVLPFAFLTIFPRLHGFDRSLEEAAMDLGATPLVVVRRVLLPIIRPGIIATMLFAFTLSFDEFIRTYLITGTDRTVPVHLWTLISGSMAPFLPAVGVIIMGVSIIVSLGAFLVTQREKKY